jgi:5,10-methylenetetrahydrofolate reductase
MKYFEKGKGKMFAQFAQFAHRKRPTAAVFSGLLPAAAVLIAALFFASCGNAESPDELLNNYNITPPPPQA